MRAARRPETAYSTYRTIASPVVSIAATNAYSDIFAMVGLPQLCAGACSAARMSLTIFSNSVPADTSFWVSVAIVTTAPPLARVYDAAPQPLVGEQEADHEPAEQEERAQPDQHDPGIPGHVEAA